MSEIHNSELLEESQPVSSSDSNHSPEASDGFMEVESSKLAIQNDAGGPDNQEFGSTIVVENHNGILESVEGSMQGEDDLKVGEDVGKEDMFVDCPDELVTSADGKEAAVAVQSVDKLEEKPHLHEANGVQDDYVMDELERLKVVLDQTVREKESISCEYKEEREAFARELASLRDQLQVFTNGEHLIDESGSQESKNKTQETDTSVSITELMAECSQIVKSACEEQLRTKATISELEAILFAKNQEIEELNVKVGEFPVTHIEMVTDRLLSYLTGLVDPQEALDGSIGGKLVSIEKGTYSLAVTYNMLLSEIDQLRQCLSETRSNVSFQDFGTIFTAARDELLELKRKASDFAEKLSHFEGENRKLVQQLEDQRMMAERVNAELGKTKSELEQENIRCSNTKEKLTMAVTKGKALVQQRDSLKQSLAEKISELEKCLVNLQEKSSALEAAELQKEELLRIENVVTSLQETLLQKNASLEKMEALLSHNSIPEELLSMEIVERCKWLVDENNKLKDLSQEFHKVKDALSLIHLPESVSSSELASQVNWVRELLYQVNTELNTMQDEFSMTRDAAQKEIDRLTASLSSELQTKDYLQVELDDMTCKYKEIVEKEHKVSLEKDHIVKMLLETSGITMDDDGISHSSLDIVTLTERCFGKMKELSSASLGSYVDAELFEKVESYLYTMNQELVLCQLLLEEDMLMKSQARNLSIELTRVSEELVALKEQKESMKKDLGRSEEKSSLLREKLTMAVKKGKGLVQDRENLKLQIDEKNSEIEKLRLQVQQQESELAEQRDQINSMSADIEGIPKLEMDIVSVKEQKDQLEKFLLDSNNMLQKVIESVDGIVLPVDSVFDEPVEKVNFLEGHISKCLDDKTLAEKELVRVEEEVKTLANKLIEAEATIKTLENNNILQRIIESIDGIVLPVDLVFDDPVDKVNWLSGYIKECQDGKTLVEKELVKVKEEISTLNGKLVKAEATIKSLEDTLSVTENDISQLADEKREMELAKGNVEQELQKAHEEASLLTSKFTDAFEGKKSLEEALALAENNIYAIISEKESALVSKSVAETELEQVKEEVAIQTNKLTEAYKTIKSLEDALSQAQTNVTLLSEQNNDAQVHITDLEDEMKKLQEEAGSQASKLADMDVTTKSLEEALLRAENNISILEGEKTNAEGAMLLLNSKLNACMEELAGTTGSLESRSVELSGYLHDVQVLVNDKTLLSLMKGFEKKFDGLKNMDIILQRIRDHFAGLGLEGMQNHDMEDIRVINSIADGFGDIFDIEKDNYEFSVVDGDLISSFSKITEGFQLRNKILAEKFGHFSSFLDEFIAALMRKLQVASDEVVVVFEHFESLKQKVNGLEMHKQEQDNAIALLENDLMTLLSACTDATRELQFEVRNNLLELSSLPDVEKLRHSFFQVIEESGVLSVQEGHQNLEGGKYGKAVEMMLLATRKVQALCKHFESTTDVAASTIVNLHNDLIEARKLSEKAIEESDLKQNTISKLEADVEAFRTSCSELRLIIEDYQAKEVALKEREAKVLSLHNSLSNKEKEAEDSFLSASQVNTLCKKIGGLEIPMAGSEAGDTDLQNSTQLEKLFYIIDNFSDLQLQVNSISRENENLQLTLEAQMLKIEQLKEEVEKHAADEQATEKMRFELSELMFGLEKIIGILGGDGLVGDQNSSVVKGSLAALEKQVMALLSEYESSKSKSQDLGSKLVQSQKDVDELSTKVKLLEDSLHGRGTQPEIIQERSIYEGPSLSTSPEISEIEDVGSLGKKTVSSVPLAAHVRTMRKGSTDHLALDIDVESSRLINDEETDEDKGHIFKSLNTSGLVPRQGKLIADRVDGIWVSGGRVLMSRPRARLGVIAYCLLVHIWLLGTIL
ncbi:trans-Golgi network-localized SYP41-interacting protein 1 [Humulus lupulus]|uniref:trans-Golgi network-localized SYP41-interacting protein 1 n=1 Tax=Humulus lupulus TaxID=3486 RepID=UPI002B403064|nr:trans-Golgi network-localized SYP41-interacting protein 1 [Humulus lupulus]